METHVDFISLVVAWFFLVTQLLTPHSATETEGDWLIAFKEKLIVDPNDNSTAQVFLSWDQTVNPCAGWIHITCDSAKHVTRVDLGGANLSGSLAPELGNLTNLQFLELYDNKLSGPIPRELGNLDNLMSLDLYNNNLSGEIPSELGKLAKLRWLRLQNNNLSGRAPFEALANLVGHIQVINIFEGNPHLCNPFMPPFRNCSGA